jgi:hypothetical protein
VSVAKHPELDKLAKISDEDRRRIIGDFLTWAEAHGYRLIKSVVMQVITDEDTGAYEDTPVEVYASIEEALAAYFSTAKES